MWEIVRQKYAFEIDEIYVDRVNSRFFKGKYFFTHQSKKRLPKRREALLRFD